MFPREKGFVLWGHCQNLLDDPRKYRHCKPELKKNGGSSQDNHQVSNNNLKLHVEVRPESIKTLGPLSGNDAIWAFIGQ